MKLIHATCVHIRGAGLLIRGASGSGKSDLALRLIGRGIARLVGDDYVYVGHQTDGLYAVAPSKIAGQLEVRGLGVYRLPYTRVSQVVAVIELQDGQTERLPADRRIQIEGVDLPSFHICPFEPSACDKVALVARHLAAGHVGR